MVCNDAVGQHHDAGLVEDAARGTVVADGAIDQRQAAAPHGDGTPIGGGITANGAVGQHRHRTGRSCKDAAVEVRGIIAYRAVDERQNSELAKDTTSAATNRSGNGITANGAVG